MVVEGRRISASPRPWPCNGRILSLLANKMKPRPDTYVSTFSKLLRREISSKPCFSISNAHEKFRNLRLVDEYDTHDPKGHCPVAPPFLMKRRKMIVIVAARDIVFALAHSGVCAAFDRVSVNATDNFSSSKCRSTKIEYIQSGKPDPDFALFESKSLKWPGFVEFDDVNGKVLTYSAQDSIYNVFDLKNYTMLYSISDKHVHEIKISPGIMLLIFNRASGHIPLKILSVEDGTVLKTFKHVLH